MSRWIDADAVKNIIRSGVSTDTEADQEYVCERIDEAPSIDIVRCGKCKNHKPSTIWAETKPCIVEPFPSIRCKMLNREVDPDDFCSYGERE